MLRPISSSSSALNRLADHGGELGGEIAAVGQGGRVEQLGVEAAHADRVADGEGVLAAAHGDFLALVAVRLRRHGAAVELRP
jgi:hypothetical protein